VACVLSPLARAGPQLGPYDASASSCLSTERHSACVLFVGGCCNVGVAPESSVCREARGGACVRHAEEVTDRTKEP
ncbi:Hypothetical protein GSB_153327, partial [Giardia duodenalis]